MPTRYHVEKTSLCEERDIMLFHLFEIEWMHRKKQVKNHISLLLDYNMMHLKPGAISHVSKDEAMEFFKENAVAYKEPSSTCLAISTNGTMSFVAEVEMHGNILELKQFCFKTGIYVDDAFEAIARYARRYALHVHRDRRLWPKKMFDIDVFKQIYILDIQELVIPRFKYDRICYNFNIKDKALYHTYDSGIEVLDFKQLAQC